MRNTQLLLLHGYDDNASGFEAAWIPILTGAWATTTDPALAAKRAELATWSAIDGYQPSQFVPYDPAKIFPLSYQSLVNEVFIDDIAEGLHQLVSRRSGWDPEAEFDVVVHSTGMLVLRAWLSRRSGRDDSRGLLARLRHIVGLAPASYGSPLAHKGRSWLAHVFNGNHQPGPDFLSTGDMVLDALELGSSFTWDLAHRDVFATQPFYGIGRTPFLFVVCGRGQYTGLKRIANEPGTDGVVRHAGVSLDSLKLQTVVGADGTTNLDVKRPGSKVAPAWLTATDNHSTLLRDPSVEAIGAVLAALDVKDPPGFAQWEDHARALSARLPVDEKWQQLVVRARDELDRPVSDFHLQLSISVGDKKVDITDLEGVDVHPYAADPSFRCFHVSYGAVAKALSLDHVAPEGIHLAITAQTGTRLVTYLAPHVFDVQEGSIGPAGHASLFQPFTTTLVEVVFDRQPVHVGENESVIKLYQPSANALAKGSHA